MPSIPTYNIDEVDMSELNKIKRALMNASSTSMLHLTNKPDTDPTNGQADADLSRITEEIYSLNTTLDTFTDGLKLDREVLTFETFKLENLSNVKENFKRSIKSSNVVVGSINQITRQLEDLAPNFNYVLLSTVTDFKEAFTELLIGYEDFSKTAKDIISYLVNDGLMKSKGYERRGTLAPTILKPFNPLPPTSMKASTKKSWYAKLFQKAQSLPQTSFASPSVNPLSNNPTFQPKIERSAIDAKVQQLKAANNFDARIADPNDLAYLDPADPNHDMVLLYYENEYLREATRQLGATAIADTGVDYETVFDVKDRGDADARRRVQTLELLNTEIQKINDPVAKTMKAIFVAFEKLRLIYEGLVLNFNETRTQVMPENAQATGTGTMEGGRLSHPSRREMAMYYASGLPKYV